MRPSVVHTLISSNNFFCLYIPTIQGSCGCMVPWYLRILRYNDGENPLIFCMKDDLVVFRSLESPEKGSEVCPRSILIRDRFSLVLSWLGVTDISLGEDRFPPPGNLPLQSRCPHKLRLQKNVCQGC
jgi:hypothetical protein